jgi:hypothetical protein
MHNENQPPVQESSEKEKVTLQIGAILDQVNVMGGNDKEIPELMSLMQKVKSGGIDPQVALSAAQAILTQKEDYH